MASGGSADAVHPTDQRDEFHMGLGLRLRTMLAGMSDECTKSIHKMCSKEPGRARLDFDGATNLLEIYRNYDKLRTQVYALKQAFKLCDQRLSKFTADISSFQEWLVDLQSLPTGKSLSRMYDAEQGGAVP